MLGHDVQRAGERSGHELVLVDLPEIDITDAPGVDALLDRLSSEPGGLDAVVNCAAWTDVDGAESKAEQAHAVNADGAGILARSAARIAHTAAAHLHRLRVRRRGAAR